jgi:anti-sigma B factor antagonist
MTTHELQLRRIGGSHAEAKIHILELTGEIDADNARELDRALRRSATYVPKILDLSLVEFFDSAGFAVLDRRIAEGGLLLVISPGSLIRRAASVIDIPFHDSINDALAALADAGV